MSNLVTKIVFLFLAVSFLVVPIAGAYEHGTTVSLTIPPQSSVEVESKIIISISDTVLDSGGYTVNGVQNPGQVLLDGNGGLFRIVPVSLPEDTTLKITVTYGGVSGTDYLDYLELFIPQHTKPLTIYVDLDFYSETSVNPGNPPDDVPTVNPAPDNPSVTPDIPSTPDTPDIPDTPENPDTPGSDEPGSDEPYLPILPPAGSVYNLAGFIPLGAGALLLFLVFFWKRKVYRILNAHAKKHGEKPEKEHLKEIADAIIKLVRDEGRYPEWKKNSDVMKRLWFDIESVLDEMNYPKIVPRGALVAEILKAARGRINRHRL